MGLRRIKALSAIMLTVSAVTLYAGGAPFSKKIKADNTNFQYTGRIDFKKAEAPVLSWPGSHIKTTFSGKSLAVIMDDQKGLNYYNIIIDGNDTNPYVIDCKKGLNTYEISSSLQDTTHTLEIYKRTEGWEGQTSFNGLAIDSNGELKRPVARPSRRIEFFGDSITSGMGNMAAESYHDKDGRDKNNYLSYAPVTARSLNAEYHVTSLSGIGIMVSWFDFIMPEYYDQLSAVNNNNTKWDFSKWTPDVVVVNLFQNDSGLVDNMKRITRTEEQIIDEYSAFVESILKEYPKAAVVGALGSMNATKEGRPWPGYIRKALARLNKKHPNNKFGTVFFEYTGFGAHPRVHHHQKNAKKLTAYIKKMMNW